jgi:photosystem II stability/assembly factor-like uncharacterized protein
MSRRVTPVASEWASAAAMIRLCLALSFCAWSSNAQWVMQDSGVAADLRGISAVSASVAWASGTKGTIIRTTDGGAHWTQCSVPDALAGGTELDFRGIQAWDANHAVVMASGEGEKSRLFRTVDGGKSWTLLLRNTDPEGFYDAFWFQAEHGAAMLLGDPVQGQFTVFTSQNGGQTWTRDRSESLQLNGSKLAAFAASNSSIVRASGVQGETASFALKWLPGFVTGGQGGAVLFERWNRSSGRSGVGDGDWNRHALPLTTGASSAGAFAVGARVNGKSPTPTHMIVVGGDYTKPAETAGTAAFSSDGGITWTPASVPPHGYRSAVQWSTSLRIWIAAGTNGSDMSRDDGRTWEVLDDGKWNALSVPFVAGPKGRIGKLGANVRTR